MVRVHLSPPPERETAAHCERKNLSVDRSKKINNCIANSKKFFIVETIKTSTKGKEIHISCKANLVNKAKDVKSNFKALEMRNKLVE